MIKLDTTPIISVNHGWAARGPVSDLFVSVAGVVIATKSVFGAWSLTQAQGEWKRNRKSFKPVAGWEKFFESIAA